MTFEREVRGCRVDWFDGLRQLSEKACLEAVCPHEPEVVRFYLARWCQKTAGRPKPDLTQFGAHELRDVAGRIARHLAEAGARVDRLVAGEAEAWTELRRELLASAARTAGRAADDFADEALQKIAVVLLTGTAPSAAAGRLAREVSGPANEYVFRSPFEPWARSVVINLVADEARRLARARAAAAPSAPAARARPLDRSLLREARAALPLLLEAIGKLPPAQRSVLISSLRRRDVDDMALAHMQRLAPGLFAELGAQRPGSDAEIAQLLGSTPRRVAANRSAARRKLAKRDPLWSLLLDVLLPHRSTRTRESADEVASVRT